MTERVPHLGPAPAGLQAAPEAAEPLDLSQAFRGREILLTGVTGFLGKVGQFTPTYEAVKIGADVIRGIAVPAGLAIGLVVWLGIFVALATVAVRSTAESV